MRHVLIADDSKSIRLSLRDTLEDCGLAVTESVNGVDCLAKAKSGNFDLIVTDLEMPVMDGFTLCSELKKEAGTRSIPIIIFSSLGSEENIEACFQLGAWAFVPKTADNEMRQCIQTWLATPVSVQHTKALVIDDSPTILNAIAEELACDGYRVATALNAEDALETIRLGYLPDIIVSDLHMPGMGGLGLLAHLRKEPALSKIPVVMMSADPGRASIRKTIQAGAASYLTKPFGSGQLAVHLDRILSDQFRILDEVLKRMEREQELFMAAMTSLVNALEAKDHYTRGHSEAVAEMAVLIGQAMGLPQPQLERLELAGRLHDLGKIGIRDEVLLKPGRLTPAEFEHIKTHTLVVGSILSPIPSVQDLVEAAVSHHEHWDGSGYPHGLAGEQIPLFARILAVADVYDALISNRSYRQRLGQKDAIAIIRDGIGSHFCPSASMAFLSIVDA